MNLTIFTVVIQIMQIGKLYFKLISYVEYVKFAESKRIQFRSKDASKNRGTAVYKARALYAMYNPASMFDDIAICNSIGVYKIGGSNENTKGRFDDENAFLQSLKPKTNLLGKHSDHPFMLYPNPASSTVTIAYELNKSEKGKVIIYDLLGREQMKIDLHHYNNKVSINVSLLRQGIYTFKYLVNNVQKTTGKLLIEL